MADDRAVLRIGEVSRRTGIAVPTLRAWERRYGLLEPARTDGGHRLYRDADVDRVGSMAALLDEGWSAAAAAREVVRGPGDLARSHSPRIDADVAAGAARLVVQLEEAIGAFDAPAADSAIDDTFARFETPRAIDEVLMPVLRRIGEGWQDDPRVIAREHFATNVLRPRLLRMLRTSAGSAIRRLVAAAPDGEDHDLGVLAGSVVAADAGWRVLYLGACTPNAAIERCVAELDADAVLVGASFREYAQAFLDQRPSFGRAGCVLGGAGFVSEDVSRLHAAVLHDAPIRALPRSLDRAMAASHRG